MSVQLLDRELDRLEGLWSDGLSETYGSYLDAVGHFETEVQPKLALAAALIEAGVRLQGLGGRAAPPTTLLIGDLCLARGSRLLADNAPLAVQVAFARAIETASSAAAAGQPPPEHFWEGTAPEGYLFGVVEPPPRSAPILRRLGPFPFWRGGQDLLDALEPLYPAAASIAAAALVGERRMQPEEPPSRAGRRGSRRIR